MSASNFALSIALAVVVALGIVIHGMARGYRRDAEDHGGAE